MTVLPRGLWTPVIDNPPNEFHLICFDPGGTIGWAHMVFDRRAFSRPDHRALSFLKSWDCGEFAGNEAQQITKALALVDKTTTGMILRPERHVVSEDFELTQLIGGKNLLSPVRINAVLEWELPKRSLVLRLQRRVMRTAITPERLNAFGFAGKWTTTSKGKDAFAAMQHAVTWVRRLKEQANGRPWKMNDAVSTNAYWDCSCYHRKSKLGSRLGKPATCDLRHPK